MQNPLDCLINEFSKLPGVGKKSAGRLAYHIYKSSNDYAEKLSQEIINAKKNIKLCEKCFSLTKNNLCEICSDLRRDSKIICVVQDPLDVFLFERIRDYSGYYHVLHGLISPIDGINPADIKINELFEKVRNGEIKEIILALNPNVKGDTTSIYIANILKPLNIKISRLAAGVPFGSNLEYIDDLTLKLAFNERKQV